MDRYTVLNEIKDILTSHSLSLASAESCTGGLISSYLTDVSGSSAYIFQNFVTYSNEAKMKYLGVKKETIDKYTVVSEEVAKEMALGAVKNSNADIAVTTTGVAGPTGGSELTPVGTVCFGFYINGNVITKTKHFGNIGRNNVRKEATNYAFDKLLELLK